MATDCSFRIPLSDVLQLTNKGDSFYAYIDNQTFKFTLANDNGFDVEKLTNIRHAFRPVSNIRDGYITIDDLMKNEGSIEIFDLETIRRVLLEIRKCRCDDVSDALLRAFDTLVYTDGITSIIKSGELFMQYSAKNMDVPYEGLRNRLENFCVESV